MKATILVLPGDGIGPEVAAEGVRVHKTVARIWDHDFEFPEALLGGCAIDATGSAFPEETHTAARAADAILLGAVLVMAGILSSLLALRFGAPLLLVFLFIGMAAGDSGPGGLQFDDVRTTYLVGSVALALILFDGGLRTRFQSIRAVLAPSMLLATIGVMVTALATAPVAKYVLDVHWSEALLISAVVASTDAAAVFLLVHTQGLRLRPRDMAKLGQLYLDNGKWQGRQVVSTAWLQESAKPRLSSSYGYQWWTGLSVVGEKVVERIEARGWGGQRIFIVPSSDLVVVVTAGLYIKRGIYNEGEITAGILDNYVLPAVLAEPEAGRP